MINYGKLSIGTTSRLWFVFVSWLGDGGLPDNVSSWCPRRPSFDFVVNIRMTLRNPLRAKIVMTVKVSFGLMVVTPYFFSSLNVVHRTKDSGRMQTQ